MLMVTRQERALLARMCAAPGPSELLALVILFRLAQEAVHEAEAAFAYRFDHPRRRADMEKLSKVITRARGEMMAALAALLTECKRLDAQAKQPDDEDAG